MNLPSNRSFGITFGCVFLIVALYLFKVHENLNSSLIIGVFSIIFFILGFLNSKLLHFLNFLWFRFGIVLGKLVSPVILSVIYFFVVTPTGIIMKILRKDLLSLKFNNKNTYWTNKNNSKSKMKNQF
tara:strand:+ start:135 stop:515 length:381 start_codon:yes stop_codon:yes gene_type:complete